MQVKAHGKNHKKYAFVAVLLLSAAVILLGIYIFALNGSLLGWKFRDNDTPKIIDGVNYSPPTADEINEGQDAKKRLIQKQGDQSEPTADRKKVEVAIANTYKSSDNVEIRAFVPGVIEADGKCTASVTKSGITVSGSSLAFVDATSSQCRVINIPLSEFSQKGLWNVTVAYSSDKYYGTSTSMEVSI